MVRPKLLEVSVVAGILGCSVDSVYRHRHSEDSPLVFVYIGPTGKGIRVTSESVDALLTRNSDGNTTIVRM